MKQMWERLESPGHYQSLQHVITHSTWDDERVWRALRTAVPERRGVVIADVTGIPKQGKYSNGVHRQYSGTLGKIGSCQVAVSTVLRADVSTWLLAMDLYLPKAWTMDPDRCARAGIPENGSVSSEVEDFARAD